MTASIQSNGQMVGKLCGAGAAGAGIDKRKILPAHGMLLTHRVQLLPPPEDIEMKVGTAALARKRRRGARAENADMNEEWYAIMNCGAILLSP